MPRIQASLLVSSLLLAAPAAAWADDVAPSGPARFTSMAADAQRSEVGAELTLGHFDEAEDQAFMARVSGQYVTPAGFGGYASIAAATFGELDAISNLELGGLARWDSGPLSVGARVGLVLPTGTEDLDFLAVYLPLAARRSSDLAGVLPEFTTLRASAAPTYRSGPLTLRGDVGIDVVVSDGDDDPSNDDRDALAHIDVGGAYAFGKAAATAELTSVFSLGEDEDGSIHNLTLGGQYDLGRVTGHAAFTLPFDTFEGESLFEGAYALSIGVTAPL
jgi:hypothetical protein